jgi:hypothetical protein
MRVLPYLCVHTLRRQACLCSSTKMLSKSFSQATRCYPYTRTLRDLPGQGKFTRKAYFPRSDWLEASVPYGTSDGCYEEVRGSPIIPLKASDLTPERL